MTHTPGPWTVRGPEIVAGPDEESVALLNPHRNGRDANGRLIATAPELLSAAREAFEFSFGHGADCDGVAEYEEGTIFDETVGCTCYLSRLKAAIDKAEGRNP